MLALETFTAHQPKTLWTLDHIKPKIMFPMIQLITGEGVGPRGINLIAVYALQLLLLNYRGFRDLFANGNSY